MTLKWLPFSVLAVFSLATALGQDGELQVAMNKTLTTLENTIKRHKFFEDSVGVYEIRIDAYKAKFRTTPASELVRDQAFVGHFIEGVDFRMKLKEGSLASNPWSDWLPAEQVDSVWVIPPDPDLPLSVSLCNRFFDRTKPISKETLAVIEDNYRLKTGSEALWRELDRQVLDAVNFREGVVFLGYSRIENLNGKGRKEIYAATVGFGKATAILYEPTELDAPETLTQADKLNGIIEKGKVIVGFVGIYRYIGTGGLNDPDTTKWSPYMDAKAFRFELKYTVDRVGKVVFVGGLMGRIFPKAEIESYLKNTGFEFPENGDELSIDKKGRANEKLKNRFRY